MTMLADFGITVDVTVHTDASAAIGIVRRAGLGKLRHLNVRYLWLQDLVKQETIGMKKVAGADNPADLATKHLNAETMTRHLTRLGVRTSGGRANSAPALGVLGVKRRGRRGGESQRLSALRRKEGKDAHSVDGVRRDQSNEKADSAKNDGAAEEFLKKTCEVEELKVKLGENRMKLRKLAAKLAKNG